MIYQIAVEETKSPWVNALSMPDLHYDSSSLLPLFSAKVSKILIAASPVPRDICLRLLKGHDLSCVENMQQAQKALESERPDLIVCTILFDDSRMFDFLRAVKADRRWQRTPFVCLRVKSTGLEHPLVFESIRIACKALGAEGFFDITDYKQDPERELAAEIERLLPRALN